MAANPLDAKCPSFRVRAILLRRQAMIDSLRLMIGYRIDLGFCWEIRSLMADKFDLRLNEQTLFNLLGPYVGDVFDERIRTQLSYRVSGNFERLKSGKMIPHWSEGSSPEWAPVQVVHVRRALRGKESVAAVSLNVLAGPLCPETVTVLWSMRMVRFAAMQIGFGNNRSRFHYVDQSELFGMRFCALFTPKQTWSGIETRVAKMHCSGAMLENNRSLLRMRLRDKFDCSYGFTHPCFRCAVGAKDCRAACHRLTYVDRACPACGKISLFNPDPTFGSEAVCMRCHRFGSAKPAPAGKEVV